MNVLFLTTNWPNEESPLNGVFVREHADALAGLAEVEVVYLERAAGEAFALGPRVQRVRYRRFGRPLSYAAFFTGAARALRRLRAQGFEPDVIHAHSFLSALPALLLGRRHRKPVVYTEHWTIFLPENRGRLSPGMRLAARLALRHADAVLPVSANLGEALRRLAPDARIRVVPNAVDERVFHPPEPGRPRGRRLITAGLLDTDRKGVDVVLRAIAELTRRDGVHLDVVGDGVLRREYERLARTLGLDASVTFHGLQPKDELARLLRQADAFVLGSRYENNPCVLLEALASGLPVVATRVGGVPEVVGTTSGVLVEPESARALAAGIEELLGRLGAFDAAELARSAIERYGRHAVARQLVAVYEEVLARRAR